jgi:hypothetical protein
VTHGTTARVTGGTSVQLSWHGTMWQGRHVDELDDDKCQLRGKIIWWWPSYGLPRHPSINWQLKKLYGLHGNQTRDL